MKKLAFICCLGILFCSADLRARTETLPGTYRYELKHDNGQVDQISFTLQPEHKALYKKQNPALEQELVKDKGSWQYNEKKQTVTVTMAAARDDEGNELPEVKVTFKVAGSNLKVLDASPPSAGRKGDVFKKVQ